MNSLQGLAMFMRFCISLFVFFCIASTLADATAVNKEAPTAVVSNLVPELSTSTITLSNQNNSLFSATPNSELWVKNTLGDDFYRFYTKKVKNKKRNASALKMDFNLVSVSNSVIKTDKLRNTYAEINNKHLEILDVPNIQFSDDIYQWSAANISIVELGSDYQQFVDDEILAGKTYKEFWDGEETTDFEDFVDDHFGFHDSALLRVLFVLACSLFAIIGYKLLPQLIEYINPD